MREVISGFEGVVCGPGVIAGAEKNGKKKKGAEVKGLLKSIR